MSVLPSAAVILICIGGFQPVASSFEMSAFSSGMISAPVVPSRSVVSGATSGCENVSTMYLPSGEICVVACRCPASATRGSCRRDPPYIGE